MDNMDLTAAKESGITVTNTPAVPVAELTLGIMFDLLRKISFTDKNIRNEEFAKPINSLLHKKTIGIIGCGGTGTRLADFLKVFECSIIGYDKYLKEHKTIKLVSFDELIKTSDIITMHIPFTPENKHVINKQAFDQMKKTACLINVSHSRLVDEQALIEALKEERIAGASIDCFKSEPYSGELMKFGNVVLTSHICSYAEEAKARQELI
jgi:D-3-phosphoglycerate dehydrogenase